MQSFWLWRSPPCCKSFGPRGGGCAGGNPGRGAGLPYARQMSRRALRVQRGPGVRRGPTPPRRQPPSAAGGEGGEWV